MAEATYQDPVQPSPYVSGFSGLTMSIPGISIYDGEQTPAQKTAAEEEKQRRKMLDEYLKLIAGTPDVMRGQTLLGGKFTGNRQGSNSLLGGPIDPMKTVLT